MTNQEAIDELIIVRNVYDGMREAYKPCVEAIDMAISALQEQELSKNSTELGKENGELHPTCTGSEELKQEAKHSIGSSLTQKELDTISRQDAIDAVFKSTVGRQMLTGHKDLMEILKHLPSAQPEHDENDLDFVQPHKRIPVQLVVSSDLISRQDAIDALDCINGVEEVLRSLPAAQLDLSGYSSRLWKAAYERGKAEAQPTIEPQRKTGEWINVNDGKWNTVEVLKCSVCGEMDNRMYRTDKFCPNCGAKMEGR